MSIKYPRGIVVARKTVNMTEFEVDLERVVKPKKGRLTLSDGAFISRRDGGSLAGLGLYLPQTKHWIIVRDNSDIPILVALEP